MAFAGENETKRKKETERKKETALSLIFSLSLLLRCYLRPSLFLSLSQSKPFGSFLNREAAVRERWKKDRKEERRLLFLDLFFFSTCSAELYKK
jgi:hypothetical protein